jgi:hypothetical protein
VIGFTTIVVWPFTFYSTLEASRLVQLARLQAYHKKMAKRSAH